MAPSKPKPYVRKDGQPSALGSCGNKRGRPPMSAEQKERLKIARVKWAEERAKAAASGKSPGRPGKLTNRELLEFLKKQEK